MPSTTGYSITTRKLRLCCGHPDWLRKTQELYNEIESFYYDLLLKREELWELSSQKTMRALEVLTIMGRDKKIPEVPIPWEKVPLYFRRAAINSAIAAAKSHISRQSIIPGRKAEKLHSAVTYYKGMYRDFSHKEITLKVWTGEKWQWMRCRLYGEIFPEQAELMSPSVTFEKKYLMLHVPVKEFTADTASVKQRIQEGRRICAIQFTNGDAFAVGTVCDGAGKEIAVKFWSGGKEYTHRCNQIQKKIEKARKSLGEEKQPGENRKYWMRLKHLSEYYAHEVSAQIIKFCLKNQVSMIILPKYKKEYTDYVMIGSGNWSTLHLSTGIRRNLIYKAWKNGILVIETYAKGISETCASCGAPIVSVNRKADEYICRNGHRGSRSLNSARNLSRKCIQQLGKQVV